jgi:hypothetical protein
MLFNPLFIDISSGSGIEGQLKANRFADPEYLFADIIKISSNEIQMPDLQPTNLSEQTPLKLTTESDIDEQDILNLLSSLQKENDQGVNAEKVEDLLNLFPELILSESGSIINSGKIISLVENGFPVELNIQTKNNEEIKLIFSSVDESQVKDLHPGKTPISSDLQSNLVRNYMPASGEELKHVSLNPSSDNKIVIDPKNNIDAFTVLSNQKEIENVKNVLNSFKTGGESEATELNKAANSFINQKEFLNNDKLQTGDIKSTKIFVPEIQVDEKASKLNDLFANKNIEAATKINNEIQNSPAVEAHSNKLPKNNYENLVDKTFKFIENAPKLNIDTPIKETEQIEIKTVAEAVKIQNEIQDQKIDASSIEMKKTEELFKDFSEKTFKIYVNASKENTADTPLKIIPLKEFNLRAESAKPFEVIHQENASFEKAFRKF